MNGRLHFADNLPFDTRHPILLPKNHPVTRVVIVDTHEGLGHGSGVEQVPTKLRSRLWIVKGRRVVRNIVNACTECRGRFTTKISGQVMAPLPKSRLQLPLRVFERAGVDYGGPYLTKQGRRKTRAKRYLCLFTCLATRVVHLEMAYSLDTDSFINAFTRMTSRRGHGPMLSQIMEAILLGQSVNCESWWTPLIMIGSHRKPISFIASTGS